MSELLQIVMKQERQLEDLKKTIDNLCKLIMRDKIDQTWVDEQTAAQMLGYSSPRTLRNLVKQNQLPIDFRNTRGRSWQYSRKSIAEYKYQTGTSRN